MELALQGGRGSEGGNCLGVRPLVKALPHSGAQSAYARLQSHIKGNEVQKANIQGLWLACSRSPDSQCSHLSTIVI